MGKKTIGNRNIPKCRGLRSSLGKRAKVSKVTGTSHTDGGNHFVLFVLDTKKRTVFYIDNKIWDDDEEYKKMMETLSSIIADGVSSLFQYYEITQSQGDDMGLWRMTEVKGSWKKGAYDLDCGVYTLVHMLLFEGSEEFECPYLNDENIRKAARVSLCGCMIFSDLNKKRSELVQKVISFRSKRSETVAFIEENKRNKAEESKRMEEELRKMMQQEKKKKQVKDGKKKKTAKKKLTVKFGK
ncbi:hypothetical protein BVRB_9g207900 [Beta vulgaris subsp. vulgaris]|nr:hypothetical protein BVRB_9g207900 [Beta vulgaris subsp. vulgaris]